MTDVLFAGSTIRKLAEGAALPHRGVAVGDWRNTTTGVRLLGTRYVNGAAQEIAFLGEKAKDVEVGRLLDLSVTNPDGTEVPKAAVRILDERGRPVWEGSTDDQGRLTRIPIVTTVYRQTGPKPESISVLRRDRLTVVVSRDGREKRQTLDVKAEDRELRIELP